MLTVVVVPRAARDHVGPWSEGVLKVRVSRPPADGEANTAVLAAVARAIDVAPSRIELVSGRRGRRKRFQIDGLEQAELRTRLMGLAD